MSEKTAGRAAPIPVGQVDYLIRMAARAPSVHNTQPWRFRVSEDSIELYADQARKLRTDPLGREMLISCGAALFGLRLAVRSLGYQPVVQLLPDPARLRLLARVSLGRVDPMTDREQQMLEAVPHRHTHRGPFSAGPLPGGLLAGLQHDALAEGSALALVYPDHAYRQLADIVGAVARRQDRDPTARAEILRWSRSPEQHARDGIPARAFPAVARSQPGRLAQRDFDLGRSLGLLAQDGPPPAATVVLLTRDDHRADWLRAGQALHRLLAHAASRWIFASLHTQPLEAAAIRALIRDRLALPGAPQVLLQLGRADSTHATARRVPAELIDI